MRFPVPLTAILVAIALLTTESCADAAPNKSPVPISIASIDWRSHSDRVDGIYTELENHYIALANLNLLQLKTNTMEKAVPNPSVYFNAKFPYFNWTAKIDNLLCDLNPRNCDRPRTVVKFELNSLEDSSRGYAYTDPSLSHWHIKAGDRFTYPDVMIEPTSRWVGFDFPSGATQKQSIENLYKQKALGCNRSAQLSNISVYAQTMASLKVNLAALPSGPCVEEIASRNATWLKFAALQNKKTELAQGSMHDLFSLADPKGPYSAKGQSEIAWGILNKALITSFPRSSTFFAQVDLPVFSLQGDDLVLLSKVRDPVGSYSSAWEDIIRSTDPIKRLKYLDSDRYIVTFSSLQPSNGVFSDTPTASRLRLVNKLRSETINAIKGSVEVKAGKLGSAGWMLNSAANPLPSDVNGNIFGQVDLNPNIPYPTGDVPSQIVILEKSLFDLRSCLFSATNGCDKSNNFVINPDTNAAAIGGLGKIRDSFMKALRDAADGGRNAYHSIAVAAIAAAKPESGLMRGVNPDAYLVSKSVDIAGNWMDKVNWTSIRDTKNFVRGPTVWNISSQTSYKGNVVGISNLIRDQLRSNPVMRDVFVVSSGLVENSLKPKLTGIQCDLYPACLSEIDGLRPSVVTVVGVSHDANGKIVPFSEGPDPSDKTVLTDRSFQIAAPASGFVVPSVVPNIFLRVSGPSFAVPMVSGTLSVIRSKYAGMSATYAISRLMACAVPYEQLRGVVAAGLLDVDCSINVERDLVSFGTDVNGHDLPEYHKLRSGKVLALWRSDYGAMVNTFPIDDGRIIKGEVAFRPTGASYSIDGIRKVADRDGEIKIVAVADGSREITTNVPDVEIRRPLKSSLVVEFLPDGADQSVCFQLSQIHDYIPAPTIAANWLATGAPSCPHP